MPYEDFVMDSRNHIITRIMDQLYIFLSRIERSNSEKGSSVSRFGAGGGGRNGLFSKLQKEKMKMNDLSLCTTHGLHSPSQRTRWSELRVPA